MTRWRRSVRVVGLPIASVVLYPHYRYAHRHAHRYPPGLLLYRPHSRCVCGQHAAAADTQPDSHGQVERLQRLVRWCQKHRAGGVARIIWRVALAAVCNQPYGVRKRWFSRVGAIQHAFQVLDGMRYADDRLGRNLAYHFAAQFVCDGDDKGIDFAVHPKA